MIVVGVDGSENSKQALRWALEEAQLRHAKVQAVSAYLPPAREARGFIPPELLEPEFLHAQALRILSQATGEILLGQPGVEVELVARPGSPSRTLCNAAADAELLVVGSRGHGGFASMLLGSVAQQCVQHAPCPVAIVRRTGTDSTL